MASIITTIYESAWTPVRDQIIALPGRNVPYLDQYLPIHLYTLLVALNNVSKPSPASSQPIFLGPDRNIIYQEN